MFEYRCCFFPWFKGNKNPKPKFQLFYTSNIETCFQNDWS